MRIKDLSKKNSSELPLEIETGTSYELKRYTTVGDLYYENDAKILTRANGNLTEGTIFQNDGTIEKENIPENTIKDFKPVSQSETPHNYYAEEHPDRVKAEARFSEMVRGDIYAQKGDVNIENPDEDANHKPLITSGFDYLTNNQDENSDKLNEETVLKNLKSAALSSVNFNGVIDIGEDVYNSINDKSVSNFDSANQKLMLWKEDRYKQIHMNDYKRSQYYNDVTNLANTQNKLQRGSLGYSSNFSQIGQNILNQFGDNDIPEDADEILSLNLSGEYNLTTDKPGTKVKAKDEVINFITGNAKSEFKDDINNFRDNDEERDIKEFSKDLKNRNKGDSITSTDAAEKFSPMKLSDAQARMITMLKNRNTFMKTIGCIYVKPFYSSDGFNQFSIPFEFKPEISEGATTAKYAAENLLNRLGSMQVYSGTELSTLTLTTNYIALAPDDSSNDNVGSQHAVNAWEYYWTNSKLEEVELQLRSLVFPSVSESNGYLVKPPIIQIKMGGEKDNPAVGDLYKYPNIDNLSDYLKVSNQEGNRYKKFVVTSVQIDKLDNSDIYEAPGLYTYVSKAREGQEDDGLSAHIAPINSNGKIVEELKEGEVLGYYGFRKRGFKVTLQMTEVTENFLDIVPDFRAYYNAWTKKAENANPAPFELNPDFGKEVIDALTATANELASQLGTLEEAAKGELEKAYAIGKAYINTPDLKYWGNAITASIISNEYIRDAAPELANEKVKEDIDKKCENDYENTFAKTANGVNADKVPELYKQTYGPSREVGNVVIKMIDNSLNTRYDEVLTSKVYQEGYSEADPNYVTERTWVKITTKTMNYESKEFLASPEVSIIIPITSFEVNDKKAFADLYNQNLINYFNTLFNSYNTLKGLNFKNIKDKKVVKYLEDLLKTFENGGTVYGLNSKGIKVALTTIPSIDACITMLDNTVSLFIKEIKTLQTNINNILPLKKDDWLNIGGDKIKSIKVSKEEVIGGIKPTATITLENTKTKQLLVFDNLKDITYFNKDKKALHGLVENITREGLKKAYETKMKPVNNIPQASTIVSFDNNYHDKSSEVFIQEQYYGTQEFNGLNQFTCDKLMGEEGSIIRIVSKMYETRKEKEKVDKATKDEKGE